MLRPEYFEGILQVRNPSKELLDFVNEALKKNKDKVFASKVKKVVNGYDYYLSSNKFLRHLGRIINDNFPGELKASAKLFGRSKETSRDIYRVNVMFRLSNLKKGGIISFKGRTVSIISIGNDIFGKDEKGNNVHIRFNELSYVKKA